MSLHVLPPINDPIPATYGDFKLRLVLVGILRQLDPVPDDHRAFREMYAADVEDRQAVQHQSNNRARKQK